MTTESDAVLALIKSCSDRLDEERRLREGIITLIATNDEKHDEAHKRVRESMRSINDRVESNYSHFNDQNTLIRTDVSKISQQVSAPIDATELVLSTRGVIAVVGCVLMIWTGQWLSTAGVKESIRDLNAAVSDQKKASEATAKLQELQMKVLSDAAQDAKTTAGDAKRQYELLRYEFQSFKETFLGKGKSQ